MGLNLKKHSNVYYKDASGLRKSIVTPFYKHHTLMWSDDKTNSGQIFEVVSRRRKIRDAIPVQAGCNYVIKILSDIYIINIFLNILISNFLVITFSDYLQ